MINSLKRRINDESPAHQRKSAPKRKYISGSERSRNGFGDRGDDVCNRLVERFAEADAFVVGSPTYYGQPAGALLAVLQRALFSGGAHVAGKPVACVAVCRRGGSTATFQCLNMPFAMINCLIVGSQYWNIAFGREAGQAAQDTEGMQTMRTLGRNMSWVIKNIFREDAAPRPPQEEWQPMNFIR